MINPGLRTQSGPPPHHCAIATKTNFLNPQPLSQADTNTGIVFACLQMNSSSFCLSRVGHRALTFECKFWSVLVVPFILVFHKTNNIWNKILGNNKRFVGIQNNKGTGQIPMALYKPMELCEKQAMSSLLTFRKLLHCINKSQMNFKASALLYLVQYMTGSDEL